MRTTKHQIITVVAILLLLLTGINAIFAGILFILSPDGSRLGMSLYHLRFAPFRNFLIPGIILLAVLGLFNCVVALLVVLKNKYYPFLVSFQGIVLITWIIVQITMLHQFNGLHLVMIAIGVLQVLTGLLLNLKRP